MSMESHPPSSLRKYKGGSKKKTLDRKSWDLVPHAQTAKAENRKKQFSTPWSSDLLAIFSKRKISKSDSKATSLCHNLGYQPAGVGSKMEDGSPFTHKSPASQNVR